MTLACKHVDDVVIGAPFIITKDLIQSLNIKKIVTIVDTLEDTVLDRYSNQDQFQVAREMGILEEHKLNSPFHDITVEQIAQRVYDQKSVFQAKVDKKKAKE